MPFFRRSNPIKTDKHEVTFTRLAANESSPGTTVNLYTGVDVGAKASSTEVAVGAHVKWVYCEINFAAETITNPKTIHWTIRIKPPGQTASVPTTLYGNDRSYVLKRGMEMLPKDVSTVYKRMFVVKIPRGYQRVKQTQTLEFQYIASSAETINTCGIFIYREQY